MDIQLRPIQNLINHLLPPHVIPKLLQTGPSLPQIKTNIKKTSKKINNRRGNKKEFQQTDDDANNC